MPNDPKTQSLDELARRICDLHQGLRAAFSNALGKALDAGDALMEAQDRIPRGHWGKWLNENCLLGVSTAELYMQLARHRDQLEAEIERVGELSLRAARKLVAKPKAGARSSKPKPDSAEPLASVEKITLILRKALSLVKSANTAGISPAAAQGNKNEALASMQQLVVLLTRDGIDLNDVVLNAVKKTKANRRAA